MHSPTRDTKAIVFTENTIYLTQTAVDQSLTSRFNTDDAFLRHVDPRGEAATRPGDQRQGEQGVSAGACSETLVLHFSYCWGNQTAYS